MTEEESIMSAQGTPYERIASAHSGDWYKVRGQIVTASKVPALLGLDAYRSALEQWLVDAGYEDPDEDEGEDTDDAEFGLRFEQPIREAYEARAGRLTAPAGLLLRSTQYANLGATLDAWVDMGGVSCPLEIKTTNRRKEWEDGVPDYVMAQVQTQMLVTGTEMASIAVLFKAYNYRFWYVDVEADPEMQKQILEVVADHQRRIREDDPPPPDGSDSAERALARLYEDAQHESAVNASDEVQWKTDRLQEVDAQLSELNAERKRLRQEIKAELGEHERMILPDGRSWSWKLQQRKGYWVEPKSFRQLRFHKSPRRKS